MTSAPSVMTSAPSVMTSFRHDMELLFLVPHRRCQPSVNEEAGIRLLWSPTLAPEKRRKDGARSSCFFFNDPGFAFSFLTAFLLYPRLALRSVPGSPPA